MLNSSPGWTPDGTARTVFGSNLLPEPLPESLVRLKHMMAEERLEGSRFFLSLELLRMHSPGPLNFHNNPCLHALLLLTLLIQKERESGSVCVSIDSAAEKISRTLQQLGFNPQESSSRLCASWFHPKSAEWLIGPPGSGLPLILVENIHLIYAHKNWIEEERLASLLARRIKRTVEVPDDKQIFDAMHEILETHPVRINDQPLRMNLEQLQAVLMSVYSPLLVISGGPGTGKTSIAVTLLRLLKRLGLAENPVLTAPTGRAAKRMAESIAEGLRTLPDIVSLPFDRELQGIADNAQTLHRLLGFNPGWRRFNRHEYAPLEYDLLILDEASMVEQALMIQLMKALDSGLPYQPPTPRMVLLGDACQLPPVRAGAPFIELAGGNTLLTKEQKRWLSRQLSQWEDKEEQIAEPEDPGFVTCVHLLQSFRQDLRDPSGRNIHDVATFIRSMEEGDSSTELYADSRQKPRLLRIVHSPEEITFEKTIFLEQQNTPVVVKRFVRFWEAKVQDNKRFQQLTARTFPLQKLECHFSEFEQIFQHLHRFRILTLTRVLPTGSDAINKYMRQFSKQDGFSEMNYTPGTPVMAVRNKYDLNLFNGDQGVMLRFHDQRTGKTEVKALFPVEGGFQTFYDHQLNDLQVAYAITVHKSQGSEFEHIALVLPRMIGQDSHITNGTRFQVLLNREIIYTAITRARKSVLIAGNRQILDKALQNRISQTSGLSSLIINYPFASD